MTQPLTTMRKQLVGLVVAVLAVTMVGASPSVAKAKVKAADQACISASTALVKAAAASSQIMTGTAGDLGTTLASLKAFVAKAPKQIKGDLTIVSDAYGKLVASLKRLEYDPASGKAPTGADLTALAALGTQLRTAKVTAASMRLQTWFMTHCGTIG